MFQDFPAVGRQKTARIAVLADGENISFASAEQVLERVRQMGIPTVLRAYCDRVKANGWDRDARFQVTYLDTLSGKNSADIHLVIDAMELALLGRVDGFALLSTDRDFAPLAQKLRGMGFPVLGIGRPETSARFRCACTHFMELVGEVDKEFAGVVALPAELKVEPPKVKVKPPKGVALSKVDAFLCALIREKSADGWLAMDQLNPPVHRELGIKIAETPEKNWRTYLTNRHALYECEPKGPQARVRLRKA